MLNHFSHFWLFATLWTIAYQALLSMALSRQEYWTGLPCCPPGDLSDPGTEPVSPMSPALAGGFFTTGTSMGSPIEPQGSPKLSVEFLSYPLPPFFFHCKKALQYFMPKLGLLLSLSCRLVEKETYLKVKVVHSCLTLWPHGLHSPWNSPGQNTGVDRLSLQEIFPIQG